MATPLRTVLVSATDDVAFAIAGLLEQLGHEPLAVIGARPRDGAARAAALAAGLPAGLDVLLPASRHAIARLVRAYEPDLLLCCGYPWRLPQEAIDAPRLGAVNLHPSLLPEYRGPYPLGWAVRNGDAELGFSAHRMEVEFDTGPVLARGAVPLPEEADFQAAVELLRPLAARITAEALERVAAGDPGEPQGAAAPGRGSAPAFEEAYVPVDWTQPATAVHRQVRAWRMMPPGEARRGPLAELDGRLVRLVRTRLEPGEGRRVQCGDGALWVVESEAAERAGA
jgi:methionyl-tRNA formyltransferase